MTAYFHHVSLVHGLTGQLVEFYPASAEVVRDGAPASGATYYVRRGTASNDETEEFTGSATLDATSTTVDAASGYSQATRTKLYLTATTNIVVGRRYLLTNAQGQREVVIPTLIASGDYIELEEPLAYDYAAADTFKGLRHVFTVDATFIADASKINTYPDPGNALNQPRGSATNAPPYRVEWRYSTAGAIAWRAWTSFDVVRQQAKSTLGIDDLRALAPDVIYREWISQRGQKFVPQLVLAETDVRIDIRAEGYDPDAMRDPELYNRWVLQKWWVRILEALVASGADVGPALDIAYGNYTRLFQKTIGTTPRAWIDTGSTGGITPEPARQMTLRR
jgi:hypothetical protein